MTSKDRKSGKNPKNRNVTVTLREDVARWARIKAAEQDTSVSRMLGDLLEAQMKHDEEYDRAMERFLSTPARRLRTDATPYPERGSLHER